MADDDFDIDIYGDANDEAMEKPKEVKADTKTADDPASNGANETTADNGEQHDEEVDEDYADIKVDHDNSNTAASDGQQQIKSTDESSHQAVSIPKQAPQQQGVKRKEGSDERPIDPGATTAILISDLNWWNTDDDVRGWINQAQCEDELKDITFSEHKVNGKSKGQAYVEFSSQQAATAAKHKIDAFGTGQQYVKKHTVTYSNPNVNPFKTLPKDAPARVGKDAPGNRAVSGGFESRGGGNFGNNNFRGGRGGYTPRGNMNNMGGGFNRNFSSSPMNNRGGFQGNFQGNNNMGGGGFGNFNNGMMNGMRGGGGMRGGRGGMNNNMGNGMMGMPMGGMPMGNMGGMGGMGGMGMNNMGGGMAGAGFQGMQPHFNPAFFQQQSQGGGGGGDWQNPHGAKRPRPE